LEVTAYFKVVRPRILGFPNRLLRTEFRIHCSAEQERTLYANESPHGFPRILLGNISSSFMKLRQFFRNEGGIGDQLISEFRWARVSGLFCGASLRPRFCAGHDRS
jgi:hypothetical protein